jgi:hypothetical protein
MERSRHEQPGFAPTRERRGGSIPTTCSVTCRHLSRSMILTQQVCVRGRREAGRVPGDRTRRPRRETRLIGRGSGRTQYPSSRPRSSSSGCPDRRSRRDPRWSFASGGRISGRWSVLANQREVPNSLASVRLPALVLIGRLRRWRVSVVYPRRSSSSGSLSLARRLRPPRLLSDDPVYRRIERRRLAASSAERPPTDSSEQVFIRSRMGNWQVI